MDLFSLTNPAGPGEAHATAPRAPVVDVPLSDEQRAIVEHTGGPMIVLAGPGTGKTRVLTSRIAHLISRGADPTSIVAMTFTVKAAAQLRERLAGLIGPRGEAISAHTFHGLGLRLLRQFPDELGLPASLLTRGSGAILDSAQRKRLLRRVVSENDLFPRHRGLGLDAILEQIEGYAEVFANHALTPKDARRFAADARRRLHERADLDAHAAAELERLDRLDEAARAVELFQIECRRRGWLSFADLIALPTRLLQESTRAARLVRGRWRHVLVDEFQDVNAGQFELLRQLAPPGSGIDICVVGDDDQSIYGFRGSDDLAFDKFAQAWPGVVVRELTRTHRSTGPIVRVATGVISRAVHRFKPDKTLTAERGSSGDPVTLVHLRDERDEPESVAALILSDKARTGRAWGEYAVIARTGTDLSRIATALELENIPVEVHRGGDADLEEPGVGRVLSMVEAVADPSQAIALVRLMLRAPLSMPPASVHELGDRFSRYRRNHADAGELTFDAYLAQHAPAEPAVVRLLAWLDEVKRLDATQSADATIERIIHLIDAAHADLLPARELSRRVSALVGLLRFARERQDRLDEPGDLRAFWSYLSDLNPDDRRFDATSSEARIDHDVDSAERPDAVRLLTAHGSKGLESKVVIVPRASPRGGYGGGRSQDSGPDLPGGLIVSDPRRSSDQRVRDEERRVFYVACTRAEDRLILLAKKNKSRSTAMHLFEEILLDPRAKDSVRIVPGDEVFTEAARAGVGSERARWRRPEADDAQRELDAARGLSRQAVLDAARTDARRLAAGALELAATPPPPPKVADAHTPPDAEVAALAQTLDVAARRLRIIALASREGAVPAAALADPGALGRFARDLDERLGRAPAQTPGTPGQAWRDLARKVTPMGPLTLSFKQVEQYARCPRCYLVENLLNLRPRSEAGAVIGTLCHTALEQYFRELRERDAEGLEPMGGVDVARLVHRVIGPDPDPDQERQLLALVTAGIRLHEPETNILELEYELRLPIDTHTLSVRLDRLDEIVLPDGTPGRRVVDYKSGYPSKRLCTPDRDDLQLCVYALALQASEGGVLPRGRGEYWLLQTGQRGVLPFESMQLDRVQANIREIIDGILAGKFERSTSNHMSHACDVIEHVDHVVAP